MKSEKEISKLERRSVYNVEYVDNIQPPGGIVQWDASAMVKTLAS